MAYQNALASQRNYQRPTQASDQPVNINNLQNLQQLQQIQNMQNLARYNQQLQLQAQQSQI